MRGVAVSAIVLLLLVAGVACGDDDDSDDAADEPTSTAAADVDDGDESSEDDSDTGHEASGGSSLGGAGTLTLGDDVIALDSALCYLQEQDVSGSPGKILFTAQARGTTPAGESFILDVSRYDEDSLFTGDDIKVQVGDPSGADFYEWGRLLRPRHHRGRRLDASRRGADVPAARGGDRDLRRLRDQLLELRARRARVDDTQQGGREAARLLCVTASGGRSG